MGVPRERAEVDLRHPAMKFFSHPLPVSRIHLNRVRAFRSRHQRRLKLLSLKTVPILFDQIANVIAVVCKAARGDLFVSDRLQFIRKSDLKDRH